VDLKMTNAEGRMSNEAPSTKVQWLLLAVCVALVSWWVWDANQQDGETTHRMQPEASKAAQTAVKLQSARKLPGAEILKNYASPSSRPEDDLQVMAHVFSNLRLLVKGDAPFRMGANEEFAAALMGQNAAKEVFLEAPHACLNAKGQLVDRWGSPLFFHVRDANWIDLRSAGPDGEMWTADDLHRRHDGEFFRGEMLPSENPREGK
jgi:hypothetical protein